MTLNAVIVVILRFFSPNSVTVVEDRPIMPVKISFLSSYLPLLTMQRGLSAIAELLV